MNRFELRTLMKIKNDCRKLIIAIDNDLK